LVRGELLRKSSNFIQARDTAHLPCRDHTGTNHQSTTFRKWAGGGNRKKS
jgi:hypothetical protein